MAITAKELNDWAMRRDIGEDEIERRTTASRTYYAAFHQCRKVADSVGRLADVQGSHEEVIETLRVKGDRTLTRMAYKLRECRNIRSRADYALEDDFTTNEGRLMRRMCTEIWSLIEEKERAETP